MYPGSPYIALEVLKEMGNHFVFCDIDKDSLEDIRTTALALGHTENRLSCHAEDGNNTIYNKMKSSRPNESIRTFVHIDPYHPFQKNHSINAMELFFELTNRNFKTMIWYAYESLQEREECWRQKHTIGHERIRFNKQQLWCGEIELSSITKDVHSLNPGVYGCGIILGNMKLSSIKACEQLGKELTGIYRNAKLPNGTAGDLSYREVMPLKYCSSDINEFD